MRDEAGRFLPGWDPDRHPLTRKERKKGYRRARAKAAALHDQGRLYAWLFRRIRGYYAERRRQAPAGGECPF